MISCLLFGNPNVCNLFIIYTAEDIWTYVDEPYEKYGRF